MDEELRKQQIALAQRLQTKWLRHIEAKLDAGELTPTDGATLVRLLMANGWSLDPTQLPQGLKGMLTTNLDPATLDDQDVSPFAN